MKPYSYSKKWWLQLFCTASLVLKPLMIAIVFMPLLTFYTLSSEGQYTRRHLLEGQNQFSVARGDWLQIWLTFDWLIQFFLTFGSCKLFTISKYETYLRLDLQIKSIWYIGANGKWVAIARTWEIVLGRNMSGSIWFLFLYKNGTIRSLKVNSSFNHSGTIVSQTKWKAPLFNNLFCFFIHSGTTSVLVPYFPRITRVFVLTV